ncbi:type II toxin-antitoxin system VapC family toxin [Pedobacter frigiditerrae]|uniref:type II toxin-antitoxin system VapC family toxin n=1 Tax=Pedobacter frigiditerrae TaxID=2530452 RepID=UPI0029313F35|nr:type II toxin-antitoxin system VapC family toxin [Pedobacter frigiditerrae]
MAERYLINTSAVIKYLNGSLTDIGLKLMDGIVDEESTLSFVSQIELQVWKPQNPDDMEVYQEFVANSIVLGIDDEIIAETIRIRKSFNLKLPDAIIAATCLIHKLVLIADNDKDFQKVDFLKTLNPNKLK